MGEEEAVRKPIHSHDNRAHLGQTVHPNWKLRVVVNGEKADLSMFFVEGDKLHFYERRSDMKVTKNLVYRY